QQRRPSSAGAGKDRAMGEDRYDQLLQGLRREREVMGRRGRTGGMRWMGGMGRMRWTGWIARTGSTRSHRNVLTLLALRPFLPLLPLLMLGQPAFAQSPNTSTIVVLVTDQSGAVVSDATVIVTNSERGVVREALSGASGSASIAALPLTGTYSVIVSKQGFDSEERRDVALRAGETATLKMKL